MRRVYKIGWLWCRGMSLWPIGIIVKNRNYPDQLKLINHERIHWEQQKELPFIFYIWYIIEWIINIFKYKKRAYIKLSFEQEAYFNDQNLDYLKSRKKYAFIDYIKFKPVE